MSTETSLRNCYEITLHLVQNDFIYEQFLSDSFQEIYEGNKSVPKWALKRRNRNRFSRARTGIGGDFMKTELHYYDIFPKVVLEGADTRVTVRSLGRHADFKEGEEYRVQIYSMNRSNEDFGQEKWRHEVTAGRKYAPL